MEMPLDLIGKLRHVLLKDPDRAAIDDRARRPQFVRYSLGMHEYSAYVVVQIVNALENAGQRWRQRVFSRFLLELGRPIRIEQLVQSAIILSFVVRTCIGLITARLAVVLQLFAEEKVLVDEDDFSPFSDKRASHREMAAFRLGGQQLATVLQELTQRRRRERQAVAGCRCDG